MTDQKWIDTPIPQLKFRFAEVSDLELILRFIRELAEYEELLQKVVCTEERLQKYLFGEQAVAEVILAYENSKPAGFALFFYSFSTFLGKPGIYLEDLFIRSSMRGKGYGTLLLRYLCRLTKKRDCGRLEWSVLDWNTPAIRFYKRLGARPMDEWTVYRLSGSELRNMAEAFDPDQSV